jgi:hypothetical protein
MTSNVRTLLSFFAENQQGFEQARFCLTVIPAQAGIHLRHVAKIKMGSRVRGNDVRFDLALRSAA